MHSALRMYVCMYACLRVCMYACMYVCMYACMHACMYIHMSSWAHHAAHQTHFVIAAEGALEQVAGRRPVGVEHLRTQRGAGFRTSTRTHTEQAYQSAPGALVHAHPRACRRSARQYESAGVAAATWLARAARPLAQAQSRHRAARGGQRARCPAARPSAAAAAAASPPCPHAHNQTTAAPVPPLTSPTHAPRVAPAPPARS